MRLSDETLIRRVLRQGKRLESSDFTLFRLPTEGQSTRFCFKVPKKFGTAPARNHIRRLMREFIRTHKTIWPELSAVVILPRLNSTKLTFQQVSEQLRQLLSNE